MWRRSLRRPGSGGRCWPSQASRLWPPFQARVVKPRISTLTWQRSRVRASTSAEIAAIEIGRPRIEPELSSSSVTTVSRNSVSRSRLEGERRHRVGDDAGEAAGVERALLEVEVPGAVLLRLQAALQPVGEAGDRALQAARAAGRDRRAGARARRGRRGPRRRSPRRTWSRRPCSRGRPRNAAAAGGARAPRSPRRRAPRRCRCRRRPPARPACPAGRSAGRTGASSGGAVLLRSRLSASPPELLRLRRRLVVLLLLAPRPRRPGRRRAGRRSRGPRSPAARSGRRPAGRRARRRGRRSVPPAWLSRKPRQSSMTFCAPCRQLPPGGEVAHEVAGGLRERRAAGVG